ncbi:hypothetical protein B0H14DRAFT_1615705 [Mycena olivaceomarginata]|nr:hypothetical protein B0H14DRAFT_1615705 [Mycena olivaceomarginata]
MDTRGSRRNSELGARKRARFSNLDLRRLVQRPQHPSSLVKQLGALGRPTSLRREGRRQTPKLTYCSRTSSICPAKLSRWRTIPPRATSSSCSRLEAAIILGRRLPHCPSERVWVAERIFGLRVAGGRRLFPGREDRGTAGGQIALGINCGHRPAC